MSVLPTNFSNFWIINFRNYLIFGNPKNYTRGSYVRSPKATSVLCCPLLLPLCSPFTFDQCKIVIVSLLKKFQAKGVVSLLIPKFTIHLSSLLQYMNFWQVNCSTASFQRLWNKSVLGKLIAHSKVRSIMCLNLSRPD